jgi:hypothetical protein
MDANPRFAAELKLAGSKIIKWVNVEPFIGVIDAQVVKNLFVSRVIGPRG